MSAWAASAKPSAWEVSTPETTRTGVPAVICVAAPAGPIGKAAEAAPAQMNMMASGKERPIPNVLSSRRIAIARTTHDARTRPHARVASGHGVARSASQRTTRSRARRPRAEKRGSARTTAAAAMPPTPRTAKPARTAAELPGRKAAADADGTAGIPAHDRDANHLVEAAREDDAHDRGAAARGGERERAGALVRSEEPAPSVRLEPVGQHEEEARCGEESGVPVRQWPAGVEERAAGGGEKRGRDRKSTR